MNSCFLSPTLSRPQNHHQNDIISRNTFYLQQQPAPLPDDLANISLDSFDHLSEQQRHFSNIHLPEAQLSTSYSGDQTYHLLQNTTVTSGFSEKSFSNLIVPNTLLQGQKQSPLPSHNNNTSKMDEINKFVLKLYNKHAKKNGKEGITKGHFKTWAKEAKLALDPEDAINFKGTYTWIAAFIKRNNIQIGPNQVGKVETTANKTAETPQKSRAKRNNQPAQEVAPTKAKTKSSLATSTTSNNNNEIENFEFYSELYKRYCEHINSGHRFTRKLLTTWARTLVREDDRFLNVSFNLDEFMTRFSIRQKADVVVEFEARVLDAFLLAEAKKGGVGSLTISEIRALAIDIIAEVDVAGQMGCSASRKWVVSFCRRYDLSYSKMISSGGKKPVVDVQNPIVNNNNKVPKKKKNENATQLQSPSSQDDKPVKKAKRCRNRTKANSVAQSFTSVSSSSSPTKDGNNNDIVHLIEMQKPVTSETSKTESFSSMDMDADEDGDNEVEDMDVEMDDKFELPETKALETENSFSSSSSSVSTANTATSLPLLPSASSQIALSNNLTPSPLPKLIKVPDANKYYKSQTISIPSPPSPVEAITQAAISSPSTTPRPAESPKWTESINTSVSHSEIRNSLISTLNDSDFASFDEHHQGTSPGSSSPESGVMVSAPEKVVSTTYKSGSGIISVRRIAGPGIGISQPPIPQQVSPQKKEKLSSAIVARISPVPVDTSQSNILLILQSMGISLSPGVQYAALVVEPENALEVFQLTSEMNEELAKDPLYQKSLV